MSEKQKTIFKTMMIQSILVSVVFMLSQAFSWVLYDALGLFIYAPYTLLLFIIMGISFIASLVYAFSGCVDQKIVKAVCPLLVCFWSVVLTFLLFSESRLRFYNYKFYEKKRESYIEYVINKDRRVGEGGQIEFRDTDQKTLPFDKSVSFISNGDMTGIYFQTDPGLLDESSGYLYILDGNLHTKPHLVSHMVVNQQFDGGWYFVGIHW